MESETGLGISQAIVISDTHCGSRLGLCPPGKHSLSGGGFFEPSDLQLEMYSLWTEFWEVVVPILTKGEPYAIILNGDGTEGRHRRFSELIDVNLATQQRIARICLEPLVEKCNGNFYWIKGTEVHVGTEGEIEESIASAIGAIPDNLGNCSRWEMYADFQGKGIAHLLHHIGGTSSNQYEATALQMEWTQMAESSARWGRKVPQILVRSHRHRCAKIEVPTAYGSGICIVTPGWQLKTAFQHRIRGARLTTPQFGGILIRAGDEELYTRSRVWTVKRPEAVRL